MKLIKLWLPLAAWAGLIFYFSGIPDLKTGLQYDFVLRKFAHITEYFILTFLFYRALSGSFKMSEGRLFIYPAFFTLVYAASDEIHQYFVAGRYCSTADWLIDAAGIIGWLAVLKSQPAIAVKLSSLR